MTMRQLVLFAVCLSVSATSPCRAHFLWLSSDAEGRALVFFGESVADQNYHMPERLAQLKLNFRGVDDGKSTSVPLTVLETDDFTGFRSAEPLATGLIETSCQYGVYHGTLLTYYAKHYLGSDPGAWGKVPPSAEQPLDVVLSMAAEADTLALVVYVHGKPFGNAEVSRFSADAETQKQVTDAEGIARFKMNGSKALSFLVSVTDNAKSGEFEAETYTSCSNYMTLTLKMPEKKPHAKSTITATSSATHATLPSLPEGISSFGAAVSDGFLYVYGGHTGKAHDHSRENHSRRFVRLKLDGSGEWEELPFETPLQGLALVAQGGYVYRVGGMTARNDPGADDDLHSTAEVSRFDPATSTWTSLPPLPAARSSHDAVFIGDKLYVAGGWTLAGESDGDWLDESLVLDVTKQPLVWEALPRQPFERRALAVAELQGHLVVIGGIDSDGDISRRVDVFDPVSRQWSRIADLPGEGMNGFGVSAWNLEGTLYASGSNGTVYRLGGVDDVWEVVTRLDRPRFFHRLLPTTSPTASLLAVGGASESGHLNDVEVVQMPRGNTRTETLGE